jgi:K(+)-stimulated pyrophosphate-energized sodium pump
MRVYATIVGLVVGAVISSVTEYYTGLGTKPVMAIVQNQYGAGTVIAGLATGMISTFPTVLFWQQFGLLRFSRILGGAAASAMMYSNATCH